MVKAGRLIMCGEQAKGQIKAAITHQVSKFFQQCGTQKELVHKSRNDTCQVKIGPDPL